MAFEQQSLHELVERAENAGIRRFTADCLVDNRAVMDLLQRLGPTRVDHPEPGLADLTINLPEEILPDGELYAALRHVAAGHLRPAPVSRDPRP